MKRLKAIGIVPTVFAKTAGVHHTTLMRIASGANCEMRTMRALTDALIAEEHRLLRHLLALHPEFPATLTTQEAA